MTPKTDSEIVTYKKIKSEFVDYTRFEDDAQKRAIARDSFINNLEYVPSYEYPKLDFLIDNEDVNTKKSAIYEAVMELEAAKQQPGANVAELELFAGFHELRLKRIMLVEAARNLQNPVSMSQNEVNRQSFAQLNEILYGKFDTPCYLGMIDTEKHRLADFVPESETSSKIKRDLELSLAHIEVSGDREEALLDEKTLQVLHEDVLKRYTDVLSVVPNTPDDVYYDVTQCVDIMNRALEAGGLAQCGWKAIENPEKSNPSTKQKDSTINLPSNTCRNASELRRLIIHEQEVHARRAQNGRDSGLQPIKAGTADYADVEEGLGVILECAVDGSLDNPAFDRARNRYITAGLALGVDGQPRDARETFEILWRLIAVQESDDGEIDDKAIKLAKGTAYKHIENAYRGTQFWMKGVVYMKIKVYYEGMAKNAEFFKSRIGGLDEAFEDISIGKYNHTDSAEKALVISAIASQKADNNQTQQS